LLGDTDIDGDVLQAEPRTIVSHYGAAVVLQPDGRFTYDPRSSLQLQALGVGSTLEDVFTYRVSDGTAFSTYATVTVVVEGINDAPIATNDAALVPPPGVVNLKVLANDYDVDGTLDPSTLMIDTPPAHGTVSIESDGSVTYTIEPNFSGIDTFTYLVRDNLGALSNVATVTVDYNAPPIAVNDSAQLTRNTSTTIPILANDSDVDGVLVPSSVALITSPTNGSVTVNPNGSVTYKPTTGYVGSDRFTYTVRDNDGTVSNVATVDISVIANPLPWRNPQFFLDVNADGFVSPIDALLIINDLNYRGARRLPNPPQAPFEPPPYLDVSGDGFVSPNDALLVINHLNGAGGAGEGEGEGEGDVDGLGLSVGGAVAHQIAAPWATSPFRKTWRQAAGSRRNETPSGLITKSEAVDYALTIGHAGAYGPLALRDFLATTEADALLDLLATDAVVNWGGEAQEHIAIRELLVSKKRR
jgi:VCBS repeat-containing protein